MRPKFSFLLATLLLSGCSAGADIKVAQDQVPVFHRLLDAGDFSDIYDAGAPDLKGATTKDAFTKLLAAVHRKLGATSHSDYQGFNINYSTGGQFVTLNYQTQYAAGGAAENFVYRIDNGAAKLVGYHITSQALILN